MKSPTCVVIDYDTGNTFSVMHALKRLGVEAKLTRNEQHIMAADRVILPGVGAFGRAAEKLRSFGLEDIILKFLQTERPFLGICVGMQLLMSKGYEFGVHNGLNIIPGTVKKVSITENSGKPVRIPLIGWYPITPIAAEENFISSVPFKNILTESAYYFVHSYAVQPQNPHSVLASVKHADQSIVAAIHKDNVIGVQFHPERSGHNGLILLDKFLSL